MSAGKALVALLASLSLMMTGCSSSGSGKEQVGSSPTVSSSPKVATTTEGPDGTVAASGPSRTGSAQAREPGVRATGSEEVSSTSSAPQTTMALESEVDRLRQNGPSRAQRKRRRYRPKAPTVVKRKAVLGDNGAPVFADPVETVPVDAQEGEA